MAGLGGGAKSFVKHVRNACGPAPMEGLEETVAWTEKCIRNRISGMTGIDALKAVHDSLSGSFVLPVVGDPAFASNGVPLPIGDFCTIVTSMACRCLQHADVECAEVHGMFGTDPEAMADRVWLQAYTGGEWHHLDIAGDIMLSTVHAPLRYDYYNLSDSEIAADHTIRTAPRECPVSGCDHYTANGLYVDDFDTFRKILADSLRRRKTYLAVRLPRGVRPDEMQKRLTVASAEVCCRHVNGLFDMGTSMNAAQMVFVVTVVRERRQV